MSTKNGNNGLIIFLIVAGIVGWIFWAGGTEKAWYAVRYNVPPDKINIMTRPTDCDFMQAPLGSKGCHYEERVSVVNSEGVIIGGDDPPPAAADIPDQKIERITVWWYKSVDGAD